MEQNKRLITYAVGMSLLVCGYSIVTHLTHYQTGVCFASESAIRFSAESAEGQSNINHVVTILKNDGMAKSEMFLSDFINVFMTLDQTLEREYRATQQLETLKEINPTELAVKILTIIAEYNRDLSESEQITLNKDELICRIIEMKVFDAFKTFLSMDPSTSPYKWKDIRAELCKTLEALQSISGNFLNKRYIDLYKALNALSDRSSTLFIAWKLAGYVNLLPQSIQKQCGPNLARYIK